MWESLAALALSIGPIILYICLAAFSRRFLHNDADNPSPSELNSSNEKSRTQAAVRQICTSPGCVRCNQNKQVLNFAVCRFQNSGFGGQPKTYGRIERSLVEAAAQKTAEIAQPAGGELFFEMNFEEEGTTERRPTKPIWRAEELPAEFGENLAQLEQNHQMLVQECEKALQCGHLWRRNDEPETGSSWFTYSLINQGEWQEQQCRECPLLTACLHQMDSGPLLTKCLFGNVFISMLPANSAIAEHRGLTNARLRVHYGLEVPDRNADKCFMRVGAERFNWSAGSAVVIDDSFPHSVSSLGCPQDRIVLVLDFWHPDLSDKERQCLKQIFPPISSAT